MPIQDPEHFYQLRKLARGPFQSIPTSPDNDDLTSTTIG